MLKSILVATVKAARAFKKGRANMFYTLEEHALSPTKGSHPFIALPPTLPKDAISLPIEEVKAMKGREYSYREVYDTVLKYAEWLKTVHGVKKDDIVALDCGNKPIFVFVWFAIWSLGARPAFINTSLRGEGFCHCVKTSTAKVLILDGGLREVLTEDVSRELASMGEGVSAVVLDEDQEGFVMSLPGHRACDDCRAGIEPTGMSTLIFTSGTTVSFTSSCLPPFFNLRSGPPQTRRRNLETLL